MTGRYNHDNDWSGLMFRLEDGRMVVELAAGKGSTEATLELAQKARDLLMKSLREDHDMTVFEDLLTTQTERDG